MENKEYKQILIRRAYNFSLGTMNFVDSFTTRTFSIQVISRQLIRSATSIGANIVEAQGSSSGKDFVNFLHHALKSANETFYWLGLLRDSERVDKSVAAQLQNEAGELAKLLGSSISKLKGKR